MATRAEALKNAIYRRLAFKYFSGANANGLKDLLREESDSSEINSLSTDTEIEQVRIADIYDDGLAEIIAEELVGFLYTKSGISSDYIMTVSGSLPPVLYYVANPIDNSIDFTLPAASGVQDLPITVEVRRKGYGIVQNGDCESTTNPIITGETTGVTSNATWARSSEQAHTGSYSWKFTSNDANAAYVSILDSANTSDMHGLTVSGVYTLSFWVYVPTTGGPELDEVRFLFNERDTGSWDGTPYNVYLNDIPNAEKDKWIYVTKTLEVGSTAVRILFYQDSGRSGSEYYYIDDISLYQRYGVTVIGDIETQHQVILNAEGDSATFISNGEYFEEPGALTKGKDAYIEYNVEDGSIDFVFNRVT